MTEIVYFQVHEEKDWIRIGYTNGRNGREHAQDEYQPLALVHGRQTDEATLHEYFRTSRVPRPRSQSVYEGDAIADYVVWLIDRGFAVSDRDQLERMAPLPFSVWGPANARNEGLAGQLMLTAALPLRTRVAVASSLSWLSSESDDWYTPPDIIEAARIAMGRIDLDPATSSDAQKIVRAATWYTVAMNGLRTDLPWRGNVWLNPPYGRGESSARAFVDRLVGEYTAGHVTQAITCLNLLSTSAQWFEPVWDHAAEHLVYRGRPNFYQVGKEGSSPSKGVLLSYFGSTPSQFRDAYRAMGYVIRRVRP